MKKLCHVTSVHSRYDIRIFEKECVSLAQNGYEVYLLVNDEKSDEIKNGVHIVSTGHLPKGRKERMTTLMPTMFAKAKEIDADVYHFHDPELMQLIMKLRGNKRKIIFDAHEDTQEQIMDKEWIPRFLRKIVAVAFGIYQKRMFYLCDAIITVTPKLVKKFQKCNKNVFLITNYPIINDYFQEKSKSNSKYVFFAGGVSPQWCHKNIIKAVEKLSDIRYRLAGPMEENYQSSLETLSGWDKVDYIGRIPHVQVEKEYKNSIAGMAVNECSQIKGEGTLGNTKLFEIMASGVPVICTNYKLWEEIVKRYNCGICVPGNDIDAIAEAIDYIACHSKEAYEMGKNGRKAVEERFNWKTQEQILFNLYEKIVN